MILSQLFYFFAAPIFAAFASEAIEYIVKKKFGMRKKALITKYLFPLLTILFLGSMVYTLTDNQKCLSDSIEKMQKAFEKSQGSVLPTYECIYEELTPGRPYEGRPYKAIQKYIEQAQKNIYVVSIPTFGEKPNQTLNCPARISYLAAIVKKISDPVTAKGFEYQRIQCIPTSFKVDENISRDTLLKYIGEANYNHLSDVAKISNRLENDGKIVNVLKRHDVIYPNSFVIIDDRYVVLASLSKTDLNGCPYTAMFTIFDDKKGEMVPYYKKIFQDLCHDAKPFAEFSSVASLMEKI